MALNVRVLEKFARNSTILEGFQKGLLGASSGPEREGFGTIRTFPTPFPKRSFPLFSQGISPFAPVGNPHCSRATSSCPKISHSSTSSS